MLIRVMGLASLAAATAAYDPTSSNDGVTLRNIVGGMFDAEMGRLATWFDDADYSTLNRLRTAIVLDLNARSNLLAPVVTVNLQRNLPSLVIAQMLYGDSTREPDLVARNNPRNPGFMPLSLETLAS